MQQTQQQSQRAKEQSIGVLFVLIATISLSTEAIAAKFAYAGGANVITALTFRYIIAAVLFSAGLLFFKHSFLLPRRDIARIAVLALGAQSATVILLFNAFRYIPAAMAILFLYLYPTIVTFLAFLFLKEPLTWRKISALLLTMGGCIIILGQPLHGLDMRGVGFSVGAAITNAVFLVGSTRMLDHIEVHVYNTYMTVMIAIFFSVLGAATGQLSFHFTSSVWVAILVLGIVCTVLAMATLFQGVKRIGASRTAIISTFEPVSTAILGFWLLHEGVSSWQILGGSLVLLGVFLQRRE
ncbi:MAG: DMT family transporter [Firmicutes bacterium]|nr:DMT family transporter [Bacillota bacterium]